jgi:sugar lactone lactonase YvrE
VSDAGVTSARDATWVPDPTWPVLPSGLVLGQVPGVAVGGDRVYVLQRGTPPVLVFDRDGALVDSWGGADVREGRGHFIRVDPAGDLWITDLGRHQVLKFRPDGRLVLAVGREGEPGTDPDQFDQPTDMAFLPSGEFFVSDGYGNCRIKRYAADGTLLKVWGEPGRLPGQFDTPHAICVDSGGRLFVSDRGNTRIVVYDAGGEWQTEWRGLPYVDGLACGSDDTLYLATGRANGFVRISTTRFEDPGAPTDPIVLESYGGRNSTYEEIVGHVAPPLGRLNVIHGIAVDDHGTVYAAEVRSRRVQRFRRADGASGSSGRRA